MRRTLFLNKPEWHHKEWTFFFQFLCVMSVKYIGLYRLQYSCNVEGGSRSITQRNIYLNNIFSVPLWAAKEIGLAIGLCIMYVCKHGCRYVYMLSYIHARMYFLYVYMHVCIMYYECMCICRYVCMFSRTRGWVMHVCMHVCVYVCTRMFVCLFVVVSWLCL
jgi:hypothetical protein